MGNIVLNLRSRKVTLTNFCLGKHLMNENDLLKDQRGSPAYISPDVLSGKPYAGKPSGKKYELSISRNFLLFFSSFFQIHGKKKIPFFQICGHWEWFYLPCCMVSFHFMIQLHTNFFKVSFYGPNHLLLRHGKTEFFRLVVALMKIFIGTLNQTRTVTNTEIFIQCNN